MNSPGWYTVQVKLLDSVSLSAFLARRVPQTALQRLSREQTINGALRLAAKRHESAEPINLTWTETTHRFAGTGAVEG